MRRQGPTRDTGPRPSRKACRFSNSRSQSGVRTQIMKTRRLLLKFATVCSLWALTGNCHVANARQQVHKDITGRIEIKRHDHSFTVKVFLTNQTDEGITVVVGAGGSGKTVAPTFFCGGLRVTPPQYLRPPRRSMRPDLFTLAAHAEVLYGSYTLGYPPLRPGQYDFAGSLHLRPAVSTRAIEYLIDFKTAKLIIPKTTEE